MFEDSITFGTDKHKITLRTLKIGGDFLLILTGGKEHIGAISLYENNKLSTILKKNHKDNIISDMLSKVIYDELNIEVVIICGIHIDNATKTDINIIISNSKEIIKQWIEKQN